jgi:hypothetical protein
MPWILKGLFLLVKTRKGRELLFAAGLGVIELAQGDSARKLYAKARTTVNDPTVRQTVTRGLRRASRAVRP